MCMAEDFGNTVMVTAHIWLVRSYVEVCPNSSHCVNAHGRIEKPSGHCHAWLASDCMNKCSCEISRQIGHLKVYQSDGNAYLQSGGCVLYHMCVSSPHLSALFRLS